MDRRRPGTKVRPWADGTTRRRTRTAELVLQLSVILDLLLHPDHRGLVVVDLRWRNVLIGYRGWLIQIGNWGWLVGASNRRRLIVDFRGLRSNTLHRIETGVREWRFWHNVV